MRSVWPFRVLVILFTLLVVAAVASHLWWLLASSILGIVANVMQLRNLRRSAREPAPTGRPRTRTFTCPVCGGDVEVTGSGFPPMVSASEVASLCRRQNGTTHSTRARGTASPAPDH